MIGIDFETYSSVSLLVQGLDNYVTAADFQPLLVATAHWNNDTQSNDVDIWDFICEPDSLSLFRKFMAGRIVRGEQFVAHNAGFERRVLEKFFCIEDAEFIDSAVISRTLGAGSHLADAAPQLLPRGHEKLEVGKQLIQKFCVGDSPPAKETVKNDPDWELFKEYCARDALISLEIAQKYGTDFADTRYEPITDRMNQRGWSVDFEALQEMKKRYEENLAKIEQEGRANVEQIISDREAANREFESYQKQADRDNQLVIEQMKIESNERIWDKRLKLDLDGNGYVSKEEASGYTDADINMIKMKKELNG